MLKAFWNIVLFSPVVISLSVWIGYSGMNTYRGVSGIDVALFAFASLYLITLYYKNDRYLFCVWNDDSGLHGYTWTNGELLEKYEV